MIRFNADDVVSEGVLCKPGRYVRHTLYEARPHPIYLMLGAGHRANIALHTNRDAPSKRRAEHRLELLRERWRAGLVYISKSGERAYLC